jgi:hypothetical protein
MAKRLKKAILVKEKHAKENNSLSLGDSASYMKN